MSFLFIDRITRLEANRQIITLKNVTLSDEVFRDHFVGCPIMPASMLIESLAQAATALLEVSGNFKKKALPVMIEHAKFRALVRPGDQLKVTVDLRSQDAATAQLEGAMHVGERLVATARLTFALTEAEEFYPPHARTWVLATYGIWLRDAELIGVERTAW